MLLPARMFVNLARQPACLAFSADAHVYLAPPACLPCVQDSQARRFASDRTMRRRESHPGYEVGQTLITCRCGTCNPAFHQPALPADRQPQGCGRMHLGSLCLTPKLAAVPTCVSLLLSRLRLQPRCLSARGAGQDCRQPAAQVRLLGRQRSCRQWGRQLADYRCAAEASSCVQAAASAGNLRMRLQRVVKHAPNPPAPTHAVPADAGCMCAMRGWCRAAWSP